MVVYSWAMRNYWSLCLVVVAVFALQGAGTAIAALVPPSIESEAAAQISETDAVLEGVVNSGSSGAYYQFQVVKTPAEYPATLECPPYTDGLFLPCVGPQSESALPIGFASGTQTVSLDLGSGGLNLQPGTTYHFRLVAATAVQTEDTIEWGEPTIIGPDQTFTTAPVSPSILHESVSGISEHSATLEAEIDPGNPSAYYQFQLVGDPLAFPSGLRCPSGVACVGPVSDAALPLVSINSKQTVKLDLGSLGISLQPGTTYHYRVGAASAVQPARMTAVSCVPGTTTCVGANSAGDAVYTTSASATESTTWTSWAGPTEQSPGEAVECPTTTLCLLAAGEVNGGGGNLYRASALGGGFLTSMLPANGVTGVSCPTASFCVSSQSGQGFIRYSTNPTKPTWTAESLGNAAMEGVSCVSVAFCAVVDDEGNAYVADTEAGVKEAAGWTITNVDGEKALRGIACSSSSLCVAIDGSGRVIKMAVAPNGTITPSQDTLDASGGFSAVTCRGETCVLGDTRGAIYSSNGGLVWTKLFDVNGSEVTGLSCSSPTLCAASERSGGISTFDPSAATPSRTPSFDSSTGTIEWEEPAVFGLDQTFSTSPSATLPPPSGSPLPPPIAKAPCFRRWTHHRAHHHPHHRRHHHRHHRKHRRHCRR